MPSKSSKSLADGFVIDPLRNIDLPGPHCIFHCFVTSSCDIVGVKDQMPA